MNVNGKPFCIYHDDDYKEEDATIEVCLPLKKEVTYNGIETKILAGGKGISVLHVGPYQSLSDSYKVITDYIINNNIESKSHIREHYIKGPGMLLKGNPNRYQTEIRILV
jgi:effector-binding domain-containing protein